MPNALWRRIAHFNTAHFLHPGGYYKLQIFKCYAEMLILAAG
jgi:hypothetical protein